MALIDFLEQAQLKPGGGSYKYYIRRAIREVANTMTADQVGEVLSNGAKWPTAAIAAFYKLPEQLDAETIAVVTQLDQEVAAREDDAARQVRLGVIAVLAQSGNAEAMAYLRQMWNENEAMRADIAIGLAQQPNGENWAFLVSSLPILDDMAGIEILEKLAQVNRRPRSADHFRDVIALGYRLRQEGARQADALLSLWAGESTAAVSDDWKQIMTAWKDWYQKQWPDQPEINFDQISNVGRYSVDQILAYLEGSDAAGNAEHGQNIFARAQCANCHRNGLVGEFVGPDLTGLEKRFSQREVVESLIHPSQVISDQYQSQKILTVDGQQFAGMTVREADGSYLVLQSDGKKIRVAAEDVEEVAPSELSAMPEGLLDDLSMSEIADLFAYLYKRNPSHTSSQPVAEEIR
jgi:putative heme-binding domain-containing protein